MTSILERLFEATTVRAVTDILATLTKECRIAWRPVGGRENNLATINLGSDPAAGLIERVTNAIDAVLEREWIEQGQPTNIRSPRAAVERWFGISEGKLENVEDLREPKIVGLSSRVKVTLYDSERADRPTVDIRDYGIGLRAEEFASSILSLNENRKLKKFFLAGAFGQGGSTALSYSQYTVFISRAIPVGSSSHPVAATIVRFNPGNLETDKHGLYEYIIDHSTGQPFIFDVSEEVFPPGTLVRHVAMDLGKYNKVMTAPTNSLWYLAHHYLFDPVLPFRIEEQRNNTSKGQNRSVAGNHRLLTRSDYTEYRRQAIRTLRNGSVTITWWVLSAEGENARDRITQYTLPSKPIVITYNGQKQGGLPNTIVRDDLKLPYLERYLIVHVNCDHLDNESRRQLFPTTRESLRDTSILEDLRRLVTETLEGDDELRRLDRERKQRYIQRADSQSVENIRRRLANRVKVVVMSGGQGSSPRSRHTESISQPSERQQRPLIPVQEPPTLLEITSPNPRHVYAGRNFVINFRTDADPVYFLNPDTFIAVINPPSFGQYTGTTNVRNGYGTAYFTVSEDNEVGSTGEITLELRPRRVRSLTSN